MGGAFKKSKTRIGAERRGMPMAASVLVLLSISPIVPADEPAAAEQPIEQIVVVAHKDRRSIRNVAANITSLSREDLESALAGSLDDAFRYIPGVETEATGTRFRSEAISIRGIGGNRVAILIDGVPLSDQFSVGSFSNATREFMDTGLVQDIEVLHGPASALYGSSAIGGVVAARTIDPHDLGGSRGFAGNVGLAWRGADEGLRRQALLSGGNRDVRFVVGASLGEGAQMDSAAVDESLDQRDLHRRAGLAKLVIDDRWGNSWRASILHQNSSVLSELDSLIGTGRFGSTTALLGDDYYQSDLANLSFEFDRPGGLVDDGLIRTYFERADVEQRTLDERNNASTPVSIDRLFTFQQDLRGAEINLWKNLHTGRVTHRLGFGIEYRNRVTEEFRDATQTTLANGEQTNTVLGEVFPLRDFPVSKTTETGAYVEDTLRIGNWTIIAALRADRFSLQPRSDAIYLEDNPATEPVALDESDVSPKLGIVREVAPGIDVYLQYAHGFRAPPYADANIGLDIPLFNIRAIPNPDLKSESSDGYEAGLRLFRPNLDGHLALFHTRYEDFIETKVRLGVDPDSGRILFQSRNLQATTIRGAEASLSSRFGDRREFGLDVSAYYAVGNNEDNGQPLNSVGPPQAVIGVSWYSADEQRQLQLKGVLTSRWDNLDESGGELFEPPGYAVLDVYFAQRLGERTTIRAGLHNLADRTYWHWADVRGLSPDDPLLPYLARAGRSASLSIHFNW
jgi:hemoglobin/transferrin/lactoferrin receptor protein